MTKDIHIGNGYGFKRDDGKLAMIKCFDCGKENCALNVMSGYCTWCGHNANDSNGDL